MPVLKPRLSHLAPSLLVATLIGISATGASAEPLTAARKAELTNLILQDCGSCHGMTLKGGLGKPLLPENLVDYTPDVLAKVILDGVPDTPMPPWRGLLTTQEADWIAAQLKNGIKK